MVERKQPGIRGKCEDWKEDDAGKNAKSRNGGVDMKPWGQCSKGNCITEGQRRLNVARGKEQPEYRCNICWEYCPTWHEGLCVKKGIMAARRNQCFVCYEHLCPDCNEPKHASKADTVFRWCPMCFTKVENASDAKNHSRKRGRTSYGA